NIVLNRCLLAVLASWRFKSHFLEPPRRQGRQESAGTIAAFFAVSGSKHRPQSMSLGGLGVLAVQSSEAPSAQIARFAGVSAGDETSG
ncbi:MAG: hypothetical protein WCL32_26410, partial [Planctomycetota bacterium]